MDEQTAGIGVRKPVPGVVYPPPSRLARFVEDNVLAREVELCTGIMW